MIRKILFFAIFIFVVAWFVGAHLLQYKVIELLNNSTSDNYKISHKNVSISGFPFKWKIIVTNPILKIIDHTNSKELSTPETIITFGYSLKNVELNFGKISTEEQVSDNVKTSYVASSDSELIYKIKFNKQLYKISDLKTLIGSIISCKFDNPSIVVRSHDIEIFVLQDSKFSLESESEGKKISILIGAKYNGLSEFAKFSSATLESDFVLSNLAPYDESTSTVNKSITVNDFKILFDNSSLKISGSVEFIPEKFSQGKFIVDIVNYDSLVDNMTPSDFVIPKQLIKNIIAQSTNSSDVLEEGTIANASKDAKIDLEFSEDGIKIGSIKLLNLKQETKQNE